MFSSESHATTGAHVSVAPGGMIANRYQVVREAGTGNFARVFQCINVHTKQPVAVKLLKKGFERDADFEEEILRAVGSCDPEDAHGLVKLVERGEWNRHAMLVFTLKGDPLRNQRMPMSKETMYACVRDVAEGLSFLHFNVKAVHTDLKPENILAEPSSPNGRKWCICDFGSASFFSAGKLDTDLITTRPYRAPEVVLSRGWNNSADAWSLGCVMYELRTGRKLFDCQTDADHIDLMQRRLGTVPANMQTGRYTQFVAAARSMGSFSARGGNQSAVALKDEFRDDPQFLGLLLSLLTFDPTQRARCDDFARRVRSVLSDGESSGHGSRVAMSTISDVFKNQQNQLPLGKATQPNSLNMPSAASCEGAAASFRVFGDVSRPSSFHHSSSGTGASVAAADVENMLDRQCFVGKIQQQQKKDTEAAPLSSRTSLQSQQRPSVLYSPSFGGASSSAFGGGGSAANPYSTTYRVAYI